MKYNWPLCADVFTIFDKLKISKWLFTERIWTYGEWVKRYEDIWSEFLDGTHVIMVSSGSAANELIALRRKWELQQSGDWPKKNKVVVPVNTWISSVTPFIHVGFEPVFVDVRSNNLNVYSEHLKEAFEKDVNKEIGTVFYTSLLGFFGNIETCKEITEAHGARFLMDNCESAFSILDDENGDKKPLLNFVTCSTSIFYSHHTTGGGESGLIFTQSEEEADWFKMFRTHGLTRGMPEKYKNPDVHPAFDFALLGSNYRSSNLQAYMASLDFERAKTYCYKERYHVFDAFHSSLNEKFELFYPDNNEDIIVPLAIPFICKTIEMRVKVESFCKLNGVETRPIVGGCLLAHTAFKGYGDPKDFPVALNSHEKGLYIGLNKNITREMAERLAEDLNQL